MYGPQDVNLFNAATSVPSLPRAHYVDVPVSLAGLGFDFSGLLSAASQAAGTAMDVRTAFRRPVKVPSALPALLQPAGSPVINVSTPAAQQRSVNWVLIGGIGAVVVLGGLLLLRRRARRNPPRGARSRKRRSRRSRRR
jgi:hypothetical protein